MIYFRQIFSDKKTELLKRVQLPGFKLTSFNRERGFLAFPRSQIRSQFVASLSQCSCDKGSEVYKTILSIF